MRFKNLKITAMIGTILNYLLDVCIIYFLIRVIANDSLSNKMDITVISIEINGISVALFSTITFIFFVLSMTFTTLYIIESGEKYKKTLVAISIIGGAVVHFASYVAGILIWVSGVKLDDEVIMDSV